MTLKDKYTKAEAEHIFFSADDHWWHEGVISYSARPFANVEEMNAALIKNWNDKVGMHDLVFVLGDMVFGGTTKWKEILEQLHGNIVLVMGNHDFINYKNNLGPYFEAVVQQLYLNIDGRSVYLNHYPFLCYGGSYRKIDKNAVYQLHGHVHSGPNCDIGRDLPRLVNCFPYQYDVGVDNNNYTPVSWNEVDKIIHEQYDKCGGISDYKQERK